MADLDFEMETESTQEAESELTSGGGPGRTSKYEPIADKYASLEDGKAIVLRDLEKNDIQNLRNLLYRRYGKENVIVRSSQTKDGYYKAVVRDREGDEYLRNNDGDASNVGDAPEGEDGSTVESSENDGGSDGDSSPEADDLF